jgi:mevalonate kinase
MQNFYSRGKLLLTGEYVVLDGALALASPTRFGQSLKVQPVDSTNFFWKSIDEKNQVWFECSFVFENGKIIPDHKNETSIRLANILNAAKKLNKEFLKSAKGLQISTQLEFSRSWGLGSSSTLINNIATWAKIDPYRLLELTFRGSGYDIACAKSDSALTYQLIGNNRFIESVDFSPRFKDSLFFVYLNKKQDSRKGIANYNLNKKEITSQISQVSDISANVLNCHDLYEFEKLITCHENIISDIIKAKPIKETLFKDYNGAIKSLGAWGGDFILVTGDSDDMTYFNNKGYQTILGFSEMLI